MERKNIALFFVVVVALGGYYFFQQPQARVPRDNNTFTRLGILSDIHGNVSNAAFFVQLFVEKGIDAFLLPGDIVDHFRNAVPDGEELRAVLEVVSAPGLPVFLIPGNHETKEMYYYVLRELNKENIIDMSQTKIAELPHVLIISLPGYNVPGFVTDDGFFFDSDDIEKLRDFAKNKKKKILLSHQIPQSKRDNGIDKTLSGIHAGDKHLAEIMKDEHIDVSVGSHIHEAGGQAETRSGTFVPQHVFSETLYINPGSVQSWTFLNGTPYTGLAALLTLNETHAMYEIIDIPS